MNVLTISGSTRQESSNSKFLDHLKDVIDIHTFERTELHLDLPLFRSEMDCNPIPSAVKHWRSKIKNADVVIICIPEYIHNMPAVIKNGLEWLTSSGELVDKKVIAMTLTPHEPRGQKAMQSLIWSLQALNAHIIVEVSIYKNQIDYDPNLGGEVVEILHEVFGLL